MRKHIALGTVMALGIGAQAMAAEGLSYSYGEIGYSNADLGDFDGGEGAVSVDGGGFSLAGSVEMGETLFGFLSYSDAKLKASGLPGSAHLKPLSLGLGGHLPIGMSVDFVGGVSFESLKISGDGASESESGWGASAGLRGLLGMVELHGGLKYVDIGDFGDDMNFNFGGRYNFTENLSAGVDFTKWDDLDLTQWGITLRYSF